MLGSAGVLRGLLTGAALVGVASLVTLQPVTPTGGVASATTAATEATDACGTVLTKADGTSWTCSFVDNFDARSLDTSKWMIQQTVLTGFRTGRTCYTGSAKNVLVKRGVLLLMALDEGRVFNCRTPQGEFFTRYTGGLVTTRGKFSQTYGRFEVRAAFPTARTPGVHGGFWMNPAKLTYGPWPASGEIDVAEWWSNDPTLVMPSLHYPGRDWLSDSSWDCRVADPSSYHTYTVDWQPTGISFFVDGALCYTRTPTPTSPLVAPQPFDHPFGMILSMGVGTATGHNIVSSTTQLPATYTVDYAKAWR